MKKLAAIIGVCALSCAPLAAPVAAAELQGITVTHSGSQPSVQGGTQRFTGQVRIDPLF